MFFFFVFFFRYEIDPPARDTRVISFEVRNPDGLAVNDRNVIEAYRKVRLFPTIFFFSVFPENSEKPRSATTRGFEASRLSRERYNLPPLPLLSLFDCKNCFTHSRFTDNAQRFRWNKFKRKSFSFRQREINYHFFFFNFVIKIAYTKPRKYGRRT